MQNGLVLGFRTGSHSSCSRIAFFLALCAADLLLLIERIRETLIGCGRWQIGSATWRIQGDAAAFFLEGKRLSLRKTRTTQKPNSQSNRPSDLGVAELVTFSKIGREASALIW
jgi:hypothetical protein